MDKTHVGKNYATDSGNTWVVGGKLVFDNAGEESGIRRVENVAANADVATLISALKKSGIMVGDAFELGVASCTPPIANTATNSAAATVTYADNVITVSVPSVKELLDSDHGEYWGTHKWLGFGVSTGLNSVVGLSFDDHTSKVTLTQADADEATSVGLTTAGQFVLYIKAEEIFAAGSKSFSLSYEGYEPTEVQIVVEEK